MKIEFIEREEGQRMEKEYFAWKTEREDLQNERDYWDKLAEIEIEEIEEDK